MNDVSVRQTATGTGTASEGAKIAMRRLNFFYGAPGALKDITLSMRDRKATAFVGLSGRGKSTLLRVMNRMYDFHQGQRAEGEVQSIYDSIAFGIGLYERLQKSELDGHVDSVLCRSALWTEVKDKLASSGLSLSGGQQQRL